MSQRKESVMVAAVAASSGVAIGWIAARYFSTKPDVISKEAEGKTMGSADLTSMDGVHKVVRQAYTARVQQKGSCCGSQGAEVSTARKLGYTEEDMKAAGDGNLGEGCGNPLSFAKLQKGEVVVDLGSGAGFDAMLAGKCVGETGRVIGVDMTPDMISKARENVKAKGISNVSFRLGEIEHLPVANNSVDAVVSNCVINLSPDKRQVYQEALRVLRPGGRLAIADVIAKKEIPERLRTAEGLACWVAGAVSSEDVQSILEAVGFVDVTVEIKPQSRDVIKNWMPGSGAEDYVVSANITATKAGSSAKPVAPPAPSKMIPPAACTDKKW